MNAELKNEITELNEVIVFGVGCADYDSCSAMYGTEMADKTVTECHANTVEQGCSITHTKEKN